MTISINISEQAEKALRGAWGEGLGRAALEALALEGYRSGKFGAADVGELVGLRDRWQVGAWLAERKAFLHYSVSDLEDDRRTLDRVVGSGS